MDKIEFENLFLMAMREARKQSWFPKDTGNMAYNSFKGIWIGGGKFRMYFDDDIAPYVVHTNERWLKGKNPHENWIPNKLVPFLANFISRKLKGKVSKK